MEGNGEGSRTCMYIPPENTYLYLSIWSTNSTGADEPNWPEFIRVDLFIEGNNTSGEIEQAVCHTLIERTAGFIFLLAGYVCLSLIREEQNLKLQNSRSV